MSTQPTIGDRIMEAMGHIDTLGWARYTRHNNSGGLAEYPVNAVCALGAVECTFGIKDNFRDGTGERSIHKDEFKAIVKQLAEHVPVRIPSHISDEDSDIVTVVSYNNRVIKGVEEMRTWFTKAALDAGITV